MTSTEATRVQVQAGAVFSACAAEARLVSEQFARLERVLLAILDQTRVAHSNPLLQEALQDMDMIAQHIDALGVVLTGAAGAGGDGLVDVGSTIRAVQLDSVAARLARSMSLRESPGECVEAGATELW